ncbi:hypothetical protein [Actinokineospora sp.]
MTCPTCNGNPTSCQTCGGDGVVPDWLADPTVNGAAAASTWRRTKT